MSDDDRNVDVEVPNGCPAPKKRARKKHGSLAPIEEGGWDPNLKKRVHTLILQSDEFAVYLDQDLFVEWFASDDYKWPSEAGPILSRVSELETLSAPGVRRTTVQRLLGEAVARVLDDNDSAAASATLDRVKAILCNPGRSRYVFGAFAVALLSGAFAFVLWLRRGAVGHELGWNALAVMIASAMGTIGALLSVIMRGRTLDIDPAQSAAAQFGEGASRSVLGAIGGLLAALAIEANVAFGFVGTRGIPLIALCGVVAGTSERLAPSIVRVFEESIFSPKRTNPHTKGGQQST